MPDIFVKDPITGDVVKTDPAGAQSFLDRGGELATRKQAEDSHAGRVNLERAKEMGPLKQAAAGLAGGLTLGIAPAIAGELGVMDKGLIRGMQTTTPYTAGDVAGTLLPALFTSGESAVARGAVAGAEEAAGKSLLGKAVSYATPAGWVNEAGGLAERGMRALLPEMGSLGSVARKPLEMAARGATEGAIISAAHTASDLSIKDKPLTWQAIAAGLEGGALIGGLLGGGIGAVGSVAGGLGSSAAKAGDVGMKEYRASIIGKRMGVEPEKLLRSELGPVGTVEAFKRILSEGGESFSSNTPRILQVAKEASAKYKAGMADIVAKLERENPASVPDAARVFGAVADDMNLAFRGTPEARKAAGAVSRVASSVATGPQSWLTWSKTLDQLDAAVAKKPADEVTRRIRDTVSREVRGYMGSANPDAAEQFWAARMGKKVSDQMVESVTGVVGNELKGAGITMGPGDINTMAWSTLFGHLPGGAAIVAGKHVLRKMERVAQRYEAEAAYRLSFGGQAVGSVAAMNHKVSNGIRDFLRAAPTKTAAASEGKGKKKKLTAADVEARAAMDSELTGAFHAARVAEFAKNVQLMGHPDVASSILKQYDSARQLLQRSSTPKPGGFGVTKQPIKGMPGLDDLRRHRISEAVSSPLSIVDKLSDGSLTPDHVAAVREVYPELYQHVVMTAMQEIQSMRAEGKFVDANQEAALVTLLGAPVSDVWQNDFIQEVQASHGASSEKPSPPPPGGPPAGESMRTPLQAAV